MKAANADCGARVRGFIHALVSSALLVMLVACGGGGGGVDDEEVAPPAPPPGGSSTGADGVPIFWYPYDPGIAVGALSAVQQTSDGGFVAAGYQMNSFSSPQDAYVIKVDSVGVRQWQRRIAIATNAWAYGVAQTADGGYIVVGTVIVASGNSDVFLLKLDASGNTVAGWPKTYGGAGAEQGYAVLPVNGGADGYVVAGQHAQSNGNVYVLRTDGGGAVMWQRSDYDDFCPGGGEIARAIAATHDGHYIVVGATGCFGRSAIALKVSAADGAEAWRRAYDVSDSVDSRLESVATLPDGSFVMSGSQAQVSGTPPVAGPTDALLIKTDALGNQVWRHTYGGAEQDEGLAVAVAADNTILLAGFTRSYGGTVDPQQGWQWEDGFIVKVHPTGTTLWHKIKGNGRPSSDTISALGVAADGGFVVAGSSDAHVMVAKFDKNGTTVDLGATDFSYTVPNTTGIVNLNTVVDVTAAGVRALAGPRQAAGSALDLLIDAALGAPASDFCSGGGSYAFSPAVPAAPQAGGSYALTFSNCVIGTPGDQTRIDGSATIAIDSLSGSLTSASYTVQTTLTGVNLSLVEVGSTLTSGIAGGMRYLRSAAGGAYSEVSSAITGQTLTFTEGGGTATRSAVVGPFTVRSSVQAGGAVSIGATIDTLTVTSSGYAFAVAVQQPLQSAAADAAPTSGAFGLTAPDNSRVNATVSNGSASLAFDTDADGAVDGTVPVAWDSID